MRIKCDAVAGNREAIGPFVTLKIEPVDVIVGKKIRARRRVLGMSQASLADQLGITFQQVQKYEKGTNRVSASRLQQTADALGLRISDLFESGAEISSRSDGPDVQAATDIEKFLSTAEGLNLARAFVRVSNPIVQKRLIRLIEALGES